MQWADIPRDPSSRVLRQFAALWLIFLLAISWSVGFGKERTTLGLVLVGIAVIGGIGGLCKPALLRPIFVTWMVLVFPIGWVVSRIILAGVYYLVFTPIGLFFHLVGRDALHLRTDPELASYWQEKPVVSDVRSYFRQF